MENPTTEDTFYWEKKQKSLFTKLEIMTFQRALKEPEPEGASKAI